MIKADPEVEFIPPPEASPEAEVSPEAGHGRPMGSGRKGFQRPGVIVFLVIAGAMAAVAASVAMRGPMPEDPVPWTGDWERAMTESAAGGKPVLVDFTADWCPPCQQLKRYTLPDKKVSEMIREKFIAVRVDLTDRKPNRIADRYQVTAIPTMMVVDSTGRELGRTVGFQQPTEMLTFLEPLSSPPTTQPVEDKP